MAYEPVYSDIPIGSTSEVKGGLFHSRNKSEAKAENERRATLALAAYQNDLNVENWMRNNEYNSPENQMARYRSAGLNPNLIYGQMHNADGVAGANASPTNFYDSPNELDVMRGVADVGESVAGIVQNRRLHNDNMAYQYDALATNTKKDVALALAQIASTYQSDKMKADTAKEIARMNNDASSQAQDKDLEYKREELAETRRMNDKRIEELENRINNDKSLTYWQKEKLKEEVRHIQTDTMQKEFDLVRAQIKANSDDYRAMVNELLAKKDYEALENWNNLWNGDFDKVDGKVIARSATGTIWDLASDALKAFAGARGASIGRTPSNNNNN